MSLFLDDDQLHELTGYRYRDAQAKELNRQGIEHKIRADGKPLVLHSHIENIFGGNKMSKFKDREFKLNMDAFGAQST